MFEELCVDLWERSANFDWLPLLAFAGGLWFALSCLIGGFAVRYDRRQYLLELMNRVVKIPKGQPDIFRHNFFDAPNLTYWQVLGDTQKRDVFKACHELLIKQEDFIEQFLCLNRVIEAVEVSSLGRVSSLTKIFPMKFVLQRPHESELAMVQVKHGTNNELPHYSSVSSTRFEREHHDLYVKRLCSALKLDAYAKNTLKNMLMNKSDQPLQAT